MTKKTLLAFGVVLSMALPAVCEITTWLRDSCETEKTQTLFHQWVGGDRGNWLNGYDNLKVDSLILTGDSLKAYVRLNTSNSGTPSDTIRSMYSYAVSRTGAQGIDSITFIRNHGYELLNYPTENQQFHVGDTIWFQWAADFRDLSSGQRGTWPSLQFGAQPIAGSPLTVDCFTYARIVPNSGALPGSTCNAGYGNGDYRNGIVGHWSWVIGDSVFNQYPPSQYSAGKASISDSVKLYIQSFYDYQRYHPNGSPAGTCVNQDFQNSWMPYYFAIKPRS